MHNFCIRYRNSKVFLSDLRARAALRFSRKATYSLANGDGVSWFSKKDRLDLRPTRFSQGCLDIFTTQQLRVSPIEPNLVRLELILQIAGARRLHWIQILARACSETGDGVYTAKHILVPGFARRGTCLHTLLCKAA